MTLIIFGDSQIRDFHGVLDPLPGRAALCCFPTVKVRDLADLIAAGMPVEMADRDTIVPTVTVADDSRTEGVRNRQTSDQPSGNARG